MDALFTPPITQARVINTENSLAKYRKLTSNIGGNTLFTPPITQARVISQPRESD
jgi:hypothetical protein